MRGFAAIPRWTTKPVPGVGRYVAKASADLMETLRGRAEELGVPLGSVLLTAHAKVLVALSGESEVCTGYAEEAEPPRPLRMTLRPGSWREALLGTAKAQSALPSDGESPVDGLGFEPTGPSFETVFQLGQGGGELADGIVLHVLVKSGLEGGVEGRDGCELEVRYRTDVLDDACAARIAGYHVHALSLIAADPDADHGRATLLSAEELRFQVHDLAGPRRKLPDLLAHELFEEQARAHPDAIAAMHRDRRVTYRGLNARANQLARALRARGLAREGVVAVVTERNLDWMTAVLAILKAGGAYLPIEPQFPADRIARTLSRADCRLVLTERGSTSMLDQALGSLSGVEKLDLDAALDEGAPDGDLGADIAPDQLAYIFFTSGSTGEPKGAMCEHGGMLNHLLAKIDDLKIGPGDVVAQTAPRGFDISMWQLLAAPLVGGRTLIVPQETVLDAERFLDEIAERRVNVVQVVPSYLEVLVSSLTQHPRELPDLRFVSATGEALKRELVRRWFAVQPRIRLANAYGLTETSDDTNHEILDRVPERERVPLGRPVQNVHVYVVDEHLSPVPLGAPGEIVFSGVCVGRGYVNDAAATRRAFLPDPHRTGERLYRSGDFGRWLPEGKLEFLGRRDSQVKIAGFRIEIGEIEDRLLRVPGVREGAVVVTGGTNHTKRLVAFYSGERALDAGTMRDRLDGSLPGYMVPAAFHWRRTLPLTANGKIDRKALTALAEDPDVAPQRGPSAGDRADLRDTRRSPGEASHTGPLARSRADLRASRRSYGEASQAIEAPATATEHRLTAKWADVLGIPRDRIGRRAHFFDFGGTSLSALRLAIALDRALSFKDITDHPVLADQATLIERRLEIPFEAPLEEGVRAAPGGRGTR